jgi:hypothetical protein
VRHQAQGHGSTRPRSEDGDSSPDGSFTCGAGPPILRLPLVQRQRWWRANSAPDAAYAEEAREETEQQEELMSALRRQDRSHLRDRVPCIVRRGLCHVTPTIRASFPAGASTIVLEAPRSAETSPPGHEPGAPARRSAHHHPYLSAADVGVERFSHASMITEDSDRRTTPQLQSQPFVESGEQPALGRTIEPSRDLKAISGLVGPDRRLRLGRKDAVDRAWVKPEVLQPRFRELDLASGEEPVHRGAYSPGLVPPWVRRDARGEQHQQEPHHDT